MPPKMPAELALAVAAADEAACAGATGDAAVAKSAKSGQTVSQAYHMIPSDANGIGNAYRTIFD